MNFAVLTLFTYLISGAQLLFSGTAQTLNNGMYLGSVSGAVESSAASKFVTTQQDYGLKISAKSAISIETNLLDKSKILFKKNSDKQLPIASLTKLMTAIVAIDSYNLSRNVTVGQAADAQDPMKQDVSLGQTLSAESFLNIMLIESSNKSAYALAEVMGEHKFVGLMNEKAQQIGLSDTFFADPTGLSSDNVSTATDLAKLAEYILKNYPKIAEISKTKSLSIFGFGTVTNTDQLLAEFPETVCSKTGFTTEAKGCLLLAMNNAKNNDYIINVVLGADDRFSEMKKIINWADTGYQCQ